MSQFIFYKNEYLQNGIEVLRREGYIAFQRKILKYLLSKLCGISKKRLIVFFIPQFRRLIKNINDIKKAIDFIFTYEFCGFVFKPIQVKEEILQFLKILKRIKPKRILEIGTYRGGTLFLFSVIAESDARLITLDLPGKKFNEGYPDDYTPFFRSFVRKNQGIHLIRGDSHTEEMVRRIEKLLRGSKVDCLFIDGDHSYKGVKEDFEKFAPLVKKDGIIALHDIVTGPEELVGGVPNFWKEIKAVYRHQEIVKSWEQGGFGIGVLFV